jgi:hypothetical protein
MISFVTTSDSVSPKTILGTCPAGKSTISGGADINGGNNGTTPDQTTDISITNTAPSGPETVPGTFFARAHEEEPHAGNWSLQIRVLCANVSP